MLEPSAQCTQDDQCGYSGVCLFNFCQTWGTLQHGEKLEDSSQYMLCQSNYAMYDDSNKAYYCVTAPVSNKDPITTPQVLDSQCSFTAYTDINNPSATEVV